MPASATTAAQRCVSAARKRVKASGDNALGSAPSFARLAFMSGEFMPSLKVALSRATTAAGVPAGASMPLHSVASSRGRPLSFMVGTSGNCGLRAGDVMASARILPASICGSMTTGVSNIIWICPASRSVMAGAEPR